MKKLLGALPVLVLLLTLCPAWGVELPVQAEAALLMEKETGQVLYAKNEHQTLEPASVTKVMTLLLVMEAIDRGTLAYDDVVTISDYAASMGGSQIFLSPGEQITVEDLLKGVCVSSGNDAAVALAEKTAGVTELFVEQMNNRARELGMQDTHFVNCTGLPAEGHVTSAWDIAVMSRELIRRHPDIRRFTTIWMDTLRDGQFQLSNTNKLIRFYEGATGLKTGSTDSARYCISATAEREGMELIAVVLKSPTGQQRFEDAKTLLNYGFSTYGLIHAAPEEPLPPVMLGAMAHRWEVLRQENAPLRAVVNGRVRSVGEDFYDEMIRRHLPEGQTKIANIIGEVLGREKPGIGDVWLAERIRQMLSTGELRMLREDRERFYRSVVERT